MRLINVYNSQLETFANDRLPPYAILSHTWSTREVQYADFVNTNASRCEDDSPDYRKIRLACGQAKADGLQYVWIDTCCINRDSSSELSEAINSMFEWYQRLEVCYVYLSDVVMEVSRQSSPLEAEGSQLEADANASGDDRPVIYRTFEQSRWHRRGWTLQELLSPRDIKFYDHKWRMMGHRYNLCERIEAATGISQDIINRETSLKDVGVSMKMSWASGRQTTRVEDEAYCLLGIFNISMPLLYGERGKAFVRLQEEIIKTTADQTILAWSGPESRLLAPSPASFSLSRTIIPRDAPATGNTFEVTNRGLRISLPVMSRDTASGQSDILAILDCTDTTQHGYCLCLQLTSRGQSLSNGITEVGFTVQHRIKYVLYSAEGPDYPYFAKERSLLIHRDFMPPLLPSLVPIAVFFLHGKEMKKSSNFYPQSEWDTGTLTTSLDTREMYDGRVIHISGQRGKGLLVAFALTRLYGVLNVPGFIHYQVRLGRGRKHEEEAQTMLEELRKSVLFHGDGTGLAPGWTKVMLPLTREFKISLSTIVQVTFLAEAVGTKRYGLAVTIQAQRTLWARLVGTLSSMIRRD